jgi:hypothetical protein
MRMRRDGHLLAMAETVFGLAAGTLAAQDLNVHHKGQQHGSGNCSDPSDAVNVTVQFSRLLDGISKQALRSKIAIIRRYKP